MLADLRRGVWAESRRRAGGRVRRRLQRAYVELLAPKVEPDRVVAAGRGAGAARRARASQGAADARALLRGEMVELDRELAAASARTADRTTRMHLLDARAQIERILKPER
jgi:hypothetical protein